MNRTSLFLLFVIFLLIPLASPAYSHLSSSVKPGCEAAVAQESVGGRDCGAALSNNLHPAAADKPAVNLAAAKTTAPAGLDFVAGDESEAGRRWLLLASFAALVLLAARIAPSLK